MINVEVQRTNNENPVNVIKRFTRRVQGAGILSRVRSLRYSKRSESRYVRKKRALKSLDRRKVRDMAIKLGKISENPRHM
jgi:ribosomal protein S21